MAATFLYERIYGYVLDEIRSATLRAGDRVPSEKELAEQFGVSRITSKRALRMLADAGVLDRRRGKGSFVAPTAGAKASTQVFAQASEIPPAGGVDGAPGRRLEASRSGPTGRQRSSTIALLFPDAAESYGLGLFCAIEERAADYGYHLLVRRTRDHQEIEEQALGALVGDQMVDGLIVFPVHGEYYNATLVRLVLDNAPLVLVDRYLPGIPACSVQTDNVEAARVLASHLLDQGHEHLAFVSPPVEHTSSIEERLQGFEQALRDRGLPADRGHRYVDIRSTLATGAAQEDRDADREALRAFVEKRPQLTAFVACEYHIATLLAEICAESAPAVDSRCAIACFDSPATVDPSNAFVHVRQNEEEMGCTAVDLLLAQLTGAEVPRRTTVPFSLLTPTAADPARLGALSG